MAQFIRIVLKNDDISTWRQFDDQDHILAKGEPAAVWSVKLSPGGQVVFQADGTTPDTGKLLFMVLGDGFSTFSRLTPLWPVEKGSFNSIVSGREGGARNIAGNIGETNATLRYETLGEFIDALAHPYARPYFNGFNPSSYQTLEVGESFDPNYQFSWSAAFPQNVKAGSVVLTEQFNGNTNVLASGLNASGTFTPKGLPLRRGTSIGQRIGYSLTGQNTRDGQMDGVYRERAWEGKRVLFMHPDSEWLIQAMTYKAGDAPGAYLADDTALAALINQKIGAQGVLGNGGYGNQALDGGSAGGRAYLAYPKAYRTNAAFIDPSFNVPMAPTVTRTLLVPRNGINVEYVLIGLDLKIVQTANANIT